MDKRMTDAQVKAWVNRIVKIAKEYDGMDNDEIELLNHLTKGDTSIGLFRGFERIAEVLGADVVVKSVERKEPVKYSVSFAYFEYKGVTFKKVYMSWERIPEHYKREEVKDEE